LSNEPHRHGDNIGEHIEKLCDTRCTYVSMWFKESLSSCIQLPFIMNVFNFYISGFLSEVSQLKFVKQFLLIAMKILMQ